MLRGRQTEVAKFDQALARILAGHRQVLALVGEPGIGKTTLAGELTTLATARGVRVAWGRAWEAGGQGPYWLWRQLFEGLGTAPEGALAGLWGRAAAPDFESAEPARAQRALFEAVAHALREASRVVPLLCVLDDLHAADTASLELLSFVLRAAPHGGTAFLLTWRDADAGRGGTRDLIARVSREATVLPLQPLSAAEAKDLIGERLGAVDDALAQTLFRATAGNPLFLVEVLQSAALRGGAASLAHVARLPVTQGVAAVVSERVGHLAADERSALEAFAVVGRELEAAGIAEASAESPHRARELATALTQAGFLRERADGSIFSHALVRDALYVALEPARRRLLHLRLAQALDRRIARGQTGLEGARAHHGLEAVPDAPAADVGRWTIAAADRARAQSAFDDAAAVLERARRALEGHDAVEAELLIALGWAHGDAGRTLGMRESLLGAMHLARKLGDARLLARAVLGYGSRYVLGDLRDDLLPLLDEAEAALGTQASALHARILARRAAAMTPAIDSDATLAMARTAVAELDPGVDGHTFIDVAIAAGSAMGDHAPPEERIALNSRLVAAARAENEPLPELRGLARLVTDHFEAGDVAHAEATLREWNALNQKTRHPGFVWMAPLFESMRFHATGRFRDARAAVAEAEAIALAAGSENARRALALHRHWLYLAEDDLEALGANLPAALRELGTTMPTMATLVHLSSASRARDLVELERLRVAVPLELRQLQATTSICALGEALAPLGPTAHVKVLRPRLERRVGSNATWGLFAFSLGPPVAALAGLLAAVDGDDARADVLFALALQRSTRMGASGHLAWVHRWWGRALAARAGQGSRAKEHFDRAADLAARLELGAFAKQLALESAAAVAAAPATSALTLELALVRETEGWRVTHRARSFFVRDVRGMSMLAKLIARPGEEIHSLELATDRGPDETWDAGDSGELLDDAARAAYRKRAKQLSVDLDDAQERGDRLTAERAQEELETLTRELSRAEGKAGRKRRAGVAAERARVVVQRRVREAIRKIEQLDAELGGQLDRAVRTGTFCVYRPLRAVTARA